MGIRVRSYKGPEDFNRIGEFLVGTNQPSVRPGNWLQPRWEYMHYHPYLDESTLIKIGIWESDGNIVGVTHHEHRMGEVYFQIHPDFTHLKSDMLEYAENHLFVEEDRGQRYIKAYINDFDTEFESIVRTRGYKRLKENSEAMSVFVITRPFPAISVPDGFRLKSMMDEDDVYKRHRVLHRGFNHPGEPPKDGIEGQIKMQSAPNYRKDLNIVVEAPDGNFVSYCGMWYAERNKIAMVEPVATDPGYRNMGLGTAAVLEGIRRCDELGATVAYVGAERLFYLNMGFEKLYNTYQWMKY